VLGESAFLSGAVLASALILVFAYQRATQLALMVTVAQLLLSHLSLDRSSPSLSEVQTTKSVSELYNSSSQRTFAHPVQERVIDGKQNGIQNAHYFTQTPAIFGYFPQAMPQIVSLIQNGESDQLSHFVISSDGLMVDGVVKVFRPDRFQFAVGDSWGGGRVVVTFPYSPNFNAHVDGVNREILRSPSGLIELERVSANDVITLTYQPSYARFFLIAIPASWLVIVGGTLTSLRRLRCTRHDEFAAVKMEQ
jgi:hypothetical protein